MATYLNLNVNSQANAQALVVGDHKNKFDTQFLVANSQQLVVKTQNNNNLFQVTRDKPAVGDNDAVDSAVTASADSISLTGATDNKLTLNPGDGVVLEGTKVDIGTVALPVEADNKLTLNTSGATLTSAGESISLSKGSIEASNLTIDSSGVLTSVNKTVLGNEIQFDKGSKLYYGASNPSDLTAPTKLIIDLNDGPVGSKLTSHELDFDLRKKLDVKQSGGSVSLLVADNSHGKDSLTVKASTTFHNIAGDQELLSLSGSEVSVPTGATFNSEQTTNLSGTTTLKNAKDDTGTTYLLQASGTDVTIGGAAKFTSPHDTLLQTKTTVTGQLDLGQDGVSATVVLGGEGSSLTAKDGATINFSDAAFELQNGGTFTVSAENFLAEISTQAEVDSAIAEAKKPDTDATKSVPPAYSGRLLRHVGLQLEQLATQSGYRVVRDASRPFYTDSANDGPVQNVALVRDREASVGTLQFEYSGATYEEKGLSDVFDAASQGTRDTVTIHNTSSQLVDRLVKQPDDQHLVMQKTAHTNIIKLFEEDFQMKSIDRAVTSGKVLAHAGLSMTPGTSKFVQSNLSFESVTSGLDVWFENADKSKFLVHNYLPDASNSRWCMIQLVRGSAAGTTDFTDISSSVDPVSHILSMVNGSDDDNKARLFVTALTDGSTPGVRHVALAAGATSLPAAGAHAMLCVGGTPPTVPINHMLNWNYKPGDTDDWQWYHRLDVSNSESQAIAKYDPAIGKQYDVNGNEIAKWEIKERHTRQIDSGIDAFIYVRFTSTDMELLVLERRTDSNTGASWWARRSGWTRTKVAMNGMPAFNDRKEIVKKVWKVQDFNSNIEFLTKNTYTRTPIEENSLVWAGTASNVTTGYIVEGGRVAGLPSTPDLSQGVGLIDAIDGPYETTNATELPRQLDITQSVDATYEWINAPSGTTAPAYVSRQQNKCFIAAVVPEPALRASVVTPAYLFFGQTSDHPYVAGSSKIYADASTLKSIASVAGLSNDEHTVGGTTTVQLSYVGGQPLKPLVLASTGANWRVATIEDANSVADQNVYIDYNSQDAPFRWIFPGYTTGAPGWYKFENLTVGSTVYRYGSESFWQLVKDNLSKLVAIAGLDGVENYTEADFGSASTTDSGPHQLSAYNTPVGANKLFSTTSDTGAIVGDVFTQADPLGDGTWKQFTITTSLDDDVKVLKHGYVEDKIIEIAVTHTLAGLGSPQQADIGALEGGNTVEATSIPDGATTTYTFWALGGGVADVQEMIVRDTLTVHGTSDLNHVDCDSIFVRSENFAVGVADPKGTGTQAVMDSGTAALKVNATFSADGEKTLASSTTTVKGALGITPVAASTDSHHFDVKDDGGALDLDYKGVLNVSGAKSKTLLQENDTIGTYKFGSLKALQSSTQVGDPITTDTVTIGTAGSHGVHYNLMAKTATSAGLTHTWDSFMKYTYHAATPELAVGGTGAAASLFVDSSGVTLGTNANGNLSVPNSGPIAISRATDVTNVQFQVRKDAGGTQSVKLNGDTNTIDGGVTTFGNDLDGKLEINNNGTDDAVTSTLPLNTFSTITMKKAKDVAEQPPADPNISLNGNNLDLRNDTVTIEGEKGQQHIVITKGDSSAIPAVPAKTVFHKNMEIMDTTANPSKFFDADVVGKQVTLTGATLHVDATSTLESAGSIELTGGSQVARLGPKLQAAGNDTDGTEWLRLNTKGGADGANAEEIGAQTLEVGNLTVSSDGATGQVTIAGGGQLNINGGTELNVASGDSSWLTVTTTNADGGNAFQAGTLKSSSTNGVEIDGSTSTAAMHIPQASGPITITRDVDMKEKKLTVKDFEVIGTMTTSHSTEVNIGDSNMLLNAFNESDVAKGAGILVNCMTTSGMMAGSCTATDFNSAEGFTGATVPTGSGIDVGAIIMVVARKDSDNSIIESNMNGIWMAGSNASGTLSVKAGTNAKFVKSVPTSPDSLPSGAKYHIARVMVHHLKFDEVGPGTMGGDGMSMGGSVFYGHGSHDDDFAAPYGYRDMMMGDIHSSVDDTVSDNTHVMSKAITHIPSTVDTVTDINLHSTPKSGATYKLVNSQPNQDVTVTGSGGFSCLVQANGGHSSFSYIGGKWYEQL